MRLFNPPSLCQLSRQSDMALEFYSTFCKCATRKRKKRRKSQFLKSHLSGTREAISLKFGMWSAAVGGHVHSKIVLFHQGSTELRRCENFVFFLPVNIHTGVTRRLLGPHDTQPCVLIIIIIINGQNCLAVQDCQARPQAFECTHILLFSINHQDSS